MKTFLLLLTFSIIYSGSFAQRAATKAERDEDARVLKVLSAAMPHNLEGGSESERSFGESSLEGLSGFHNDMNFTTRDVFDHQYTINYSFTQAIPELKDKVEAARSRNDIEYLMGVSECEIGIWVNSTFTADNFPYASSPVKKISRSYCPEVYRDEKGNQFTFLFFGKNWSVTPASYQFDDGYSKPQNRYTLKTKTSLHHGTDVQSIMVYVKGHADLADIILKQVDWAAISQLIGTGRIQDDETESDLKKYFPEKTVAPVAGNNTLSFTYIDKDGVEKQFSISSSKHDLTNCALLRNHNENPKVMQEAHIDFRIADDKDPNRLFHLSLPIIRTAGTVTATFESDYDYQVMWRGNTDASHSFSPATIEIQLLKWAPVGGFMEGTFSGTATMKNHNDFSSEKPVYTIKNGKFRIRRIPDEMR